MDNILSWVLSFVLGMASVWAVVSKTIPSLRKVERVGRSMIALLDNVLDSVEDKKLSKEEVAGLRKGLDELIKELKNG